MRSTRLSFLLLLSLLLLACGLLPRAAEILPTASPTPAAAATLAPPQSTVADPPASTEAQPASTLPPPPTPTLLSEKTLQQDLAALLADPDWPPPGLSPERLAAWQAFAAGSADLSSPEQEILQAFLTRWDLLHSLAGQPVPDSAEIAGWLVTELPDPQSGEIFPVLFPVDDQGRIFVVVRDGQNRPKSLLLAPALESLTPRPSLDGELVEYLDPKGAVLLRLDGRYLEEGDAFGEGLLGLAKDHGADRAYLAARVLPRYRVTLEGFPSSFYLLENLTYNQLLLLLSTLQIYDRPQFAGLREYLFLPGDQAPFLLTRQPHPVAAAMAYRLGGNPKRGLMLLFTRNLFDNKYETAASIAHESAHIWQGSGHGCDQPQLRLRDDVGDGKIPPDFYAWSPDQLFEAVQSGQAGAYHLSLWVAAKFNLSDYIQFYRTIITTSTANDLRLLNCTQ